MFSILQAVISKAEVKETVRIGGIDLLCHLVTFNGFNRFTQLFIENAQVVMCLGVLGVDFYGFQ